MTAMRPVLLVYGNCQASVLADALRCTGTVRASYEVVYFASFDDPSGTETRLTDDVIERIVLVAEQRGQWAGLSERLTIPSTARIVVFPALGLMSLWPLTTLNDPTLVPEPPIYPYGRFPYRDRLILDMLEQDLAPEVILDTYRHTSIAGRIDPNRLFEIEAARMEALDQASDIAMADIVLDSMRSRQIFWTYNHPTAELFAILASRLVPALGLEVGESIRKTNREICAWITATEPRGEIHVPIHPDVVDALELGWHDSTLRYRSYDLSNLTYDEYWRAYIEEASGRRKSQSTPVHGVVRADS